jgi:hypothetical protein
MAESKRGGEQTRRRASIRKNDKETIKIWTAIPGKREEYRNPDKTSWSIWDND